MMSSYTLLYSALAAISGCAPPALVDVQGTKVPRSLVRELCDTAASGRPDRAHWDGSQRWLFAPDGTLLGIECNLMALTAIGDVLSVQVSIAAPASEPLTLYLRSQGWTDDRPVVNASGGR